MYTHTHTHTHTYTVSEIVQGSHRNLLQKIEFG